MKLGIMQPYFFPYIGYFRLLASVDLMIVYDTVQFSKGGWVNRNRILHPNDGWKYITVPLERSSFQNHIENKTSIKDVRISTKPTWQNHILDQLNHYKTSAPFYGETDLLARDCLFFELQTISQLNVYSLAHVCDRIGIAFNYRMASELDLHMDPGFDAQDKVLHICKMLGATEYINLPGGVDLYDACKFEKADIKLTFQKAVEFTYICGKYEFIPNLSIIDVMMWNSPESIRAFLASS